MNDDRNYFVHVQYKNKNGFIEKEGSYTVSTNYEPEEAFEKAYKEARESEPKLTAVIVSFNRI